MRRVYTKLLAGLDETVDLGNVDRRLEKATGIAALVKLTHLDVHRIRGVVGEEWRHARQVEGDPMQV